MMRAIVHYAALFVLRATKSFVDQSIRSTYLASMVHRYIKHTRPTLSYVLEAMIKDFMCISGLVEKNTELSMDIIHLCGG
eukprot:scaffold4403_cov177-Chaetoceros_neogracile.AAC.1